MNKPQDSLALSLLIGGIGLAAITALFLPAVHVRGADSTLLGVSAWQAVPLLTTLKLLTLAAALAAAFLPRLAELRVPLTIFALLMMFAPAFGALAAGAHQGSDLRGTLATLSGNQSPWVDPGWGIVALIVAALMLTGALVRSNPRRGRA